MREIILPFGIYQDWHSWILSTIFLFYKVYTSTLDMFLRWILICVWYGHSLEGSAPFLRVLFFFDVYEFLGGGSEVVREYFQSLLRNMASLSCPISLGISALISGYSIVLPLVWRRYFLCFLLVPKFPMMKGAKNSQRDWFALSWGIFSVPSSSHDSKGLDGLLDRPQSLTIFLTVLQNSLKYCSVTASNVPVSLHLSFCFHSLVVNKVLVGCLLSLRWAFWFSRLFSCSVSSRR